LAFVRHLLIVKSLAKAAPAQVEIASLGVMKTGQSTSAMEVLINLSFEDIIAASEFVILPKFRTPEVT
jgi:hypothetical protein